MCYAHVIYSPCCERAFCIYLILKVLDLANVAWGERIVAWSVWALFLHSAAVVVGCHKNEQIGREILESAGEN